MYIALKSHVAFVQKSLCSMTFEGAQSPVDSTDMHECRSVFENEMNEVSRLMKYPTHSMAFFLCPLLCCGPLKGTSSLRPGPFFLVKSRFLHKRNLR